METRLEFKTPQEWALFHKNFLTVPEITEEKILQYYRQAMEHEMGHASTAEIAFDSYEVFLTLENLSLSLSNVNVWKKDSGSDTFDTVRLTYKFVDKQWYLEFEEIVELLGKVKI